MTVRGAWHGRRVGGGRGALQAGRRRSVLRRRAAGSAQLHGPARCMWGPASDRLRERLQGATDVGQAIRIVEAALLTRLAAAPAADPMVTAALCILARDPRRHASSRCNGRRALAAAVHPPLRSRRRAHAKALRASVALLRVAVERGSRRAARLGRAGGGVGLLRPIAPDPRVQGTGRDDAEGLRTGPCRLADACADRRGDFRVRRGKISNPAPAGIASVESSMRSIP